MLKSGSVNQRTPKSEGYEEDPWKKAGHALLVIADFNSIHTPPTLFNFRSISSDQPVTVKPFQFSPSDTVAYEGGYQPAFF